MGKLFGKHHVRLDDGTMWSVDHAEGDEDSLEWILRYGRLEDINRHRMTIASIVSSYTALLHNTTRRRNAVVSEILRTLEATDSPSKETT